MIGSSKELIQINLDSTSTTFSIDHFFTFPFWPLTLITEYGDNLLSGIVEGKSHHELSTVAALVDSSDNECLIFETIVTCKCGLHPGSPIQTSTDGIAG